MDDTKRKTKLALKIGGMFLGGIGIALTCIGSYLDGFRGGYLNGTRDSVIVNKLKERGDILSDPVLEYFEENIKI